MRRDKPKKFDDPHNRHKASHPAPELALPRGTTSLPVESTSNPALPWSSGTTEPFGTVDPVGRSNRLLVRQLATAINAFEGQAGLGDMQRGSSLSVDMWGM